MRTPSRGPRRPLDDHGDQPDPLDRYIPCCCPLPCDRHPGTGDDWDELQGHPERIPVEDSSWTCPLSCGVGGTCVAGDEKTAALIHLMAHRR